jgi:hypothetical protein
MLLATTCVMAFAAHAASPPAAAASSSGRIWISITNEYESHLNFGPLGSGHRNGTDRAEGTLTRLGTNYVGTVDAEVVSTQQVGGMERNCGPTDYVDSQTLKVTGRPASGFNDLVQSVTPTSGQPSNEFLVLEFVPETATTQQPQNRNPGEDTVVKCHTLIETEATVTNTQTGWSDILFLPLNDSRWTMKGGGYIIRLPASGELDYTDTAVAEGDPQTVGPFQVKKSVWKIKVIRLP